MKDAAETKPTSSIRRKILFPFGAVLFVLIAASVAAAYWLQEHSIREKVEMRLRGLEILFEERIQNQALLLEGLAHWIRSRPALEAAWKAKNHQAVREEGRPLFEELRSNERVFEMTFSDPEMKEALSFHSQPVLPKSEIHLPVQSGGAKPSFGLEISKNGRLYLHYRTPWKTDGSLLGWIDIVQEFDHHIATMEKVLGVNLLITARKDRIQRSLWEQNFLLEEIQNPWDLLNDYVIMDETLGDVFLTLEPLKELYRDGKKNVSFDFKIGSQVYQTGFAQLLDFYGSEIGDLVVLTDITDEKDFLFRLALLLTVLSILVGGSVMIFFTLYIGRIERQIIESREYLKLEIEEREWAQKIQQESEARYRELVENANSIILRMDPQGKITFFNEFAQKFFGFSEEEIVGRNIIGSIVPESESEGGRSLAAIMEEMLRNPGAFTNHVNENISKNGQRYWIAWANKIIFDEKKKACEVLCVGNDITERKKAEDKLETVAQELARSNRELEQFAYVASHDLQEPLRKINAFSDLLSEKDQSCLDEESKDYLRRMRSAAKRMSQLIHDLLAYSRVTTQQQPFQPVELKQIVSEVTQDLEMRLMETGGTLETGELPVISADPLQMRQLFQNLIGNALKYRKPERAPVVKVSAWEEKDSYVLQFEDNGIGFDEKYKDRIFAPFQRLHTRQEYEGTGIGLAICKKIVEHHGGRFEVQSQPDIGSIFRVFLPKTK